MENIQARCSRSFWQSTIAFAIDGKKKFLADCTGSVIIPVGVNKKES